MGDSKLSSNPDKKEGRNRFSLSGGFDGLSQSSSQRFSEGNVSSVGQQSLPGSKPATETDASCIEAMRDDGDRVRLRAFQDDAPSHIDYVGPGTDGLQLVSDGTSSSMGRGLTESRSTPATSASGVDPHWEAWWQHREGKPQQRRGSSGSSDGGLSTLTLPTGNDLYSMPPPPKLGMIWGADGDELDLSASLDGGRSGGGGRVRRATTLSSKQLTQIRSGGGARRDSLPGIARSHFNVHYMPKALHQVRSPLSDVDL